MSPTKPTTISNRLFQGSLSLEWSLLLLTEDESDRLSTDNVFDVSASSSSNGVDALKNWIAHEFLCPQQTLWLTSDMKTLDSDCQATLRRTQDASDTPQTITSEQPFYPYRTILWNDPVVLESRETLKATNTEYTVWTIEYPVYSYANRSKEKETVQETLQELLNKQIEEESVVWEDGILAVVGNEMEVFYSPTTNNNHYWRTNGEYMLELGPLRLHPIQAIGAIIAVAQTIGLILLHIFVNPYLKDRLRRKKLEKGQLHVHLAPTKQHGSHQQQRFSSSLSHSDQSIRTQDFTKRDFVPTNIAIPEKAKR
eukprot:CAMPEP_0113645824 /NCGR_PEP_ID=MMETSP0017_2-20120614/24171_1 /TAXON_ID=2856 /ORGANISM="Cylindrotheca closterium" /LENGTH=310 /DNA_ID=CAMNT_0000557615 /DNA_START=28 /DNA_END=957 /DNA_ORIENTATION=+ /assembly_acc=CAM_ASM_000147